MTKRLGSHEVILDDEILKKCFPNSSEAKGAFLVLFRDSLTSGLASLSSAIDAKETKQVEFLAHRMRGSAAAIGARRLSEVFRTIEAGVHHGTAGSLRLLFCDAVAANSELFESLGI